MPHPSRSLLVRYGVVVPCVAIALAARALMGPLLNEHYPFPTFYIAVTFVAWYEGLGPALATIALACVAADWYFIPPIYQFSFPGDSHFVDAVAFCVVASIIALTTEGLQAARRQAQGHAARAQEHEVELQHEVAERRRAEDALREADRRKDEFIAMLGHELRNPLAPIRNALDILRLQGDEPAAVEQVRGMMERQVRQLVRLVDDLLDVSRVTRGKIRLEKETIDLATVVRGAAETTRHLIESRRHRLTIRMPDEPVYVEADPIRMEQVLVNLLNNAAKYTEVGGAIDLNVTVEEKRTRIAVRDNGIGIRPDMLAHIFDLFVQTERSLERAQGGLGVGLTLVRSLVEMHAGTLQAFSEGPGKGSEFVVHLPTCNRPGADSEKISSPSAETIRESARKTWKPHRTLVVDDNDDAADSLAAILRLTGHEVHTAHDGPAAIQEAIAFRPEVVFLDIGLPGMNGYDVARSLRDRPETAASLLVALTGYGQDEDRQRSREAGFDYHLVKPIDPGDLGQFLRTLPVPLR